MRRRYRGQKAHGTGYGSWLCVPADGVEFTPHLTDGARSTEHNRLTVAQQAALQHTTVQCSRKRVRQLNKT